MTGAHTIGAPRGWRGLKPATRVVLAMAALVVGANVVLAGVQWLSGGPGPTGEPSSSYATAPDGAAAYADLLVRHGHQVRRLRDRLDRSNVRAGATVMVLDPEEVDDSEAEAVGRLVRDGGRLVAAGPQTAPMLRKLIGDGLVWSPDGAETATTLAPAAEVAGAGPVRAAGYGSWAKSGSALPVLGDDERVLAAVANVGRGRVVLLADPSVVQNRFLGQEGNAAFALAAAGAPGPPVLFAEAAHGYGRSEGLGALPSRSKWALGGLVVAALVWMWARGTRFGPAEEASRKLPPPRQAYVDAMAANLARTRQPEAAIQPLRASARVRLARRAGLPPDAADGDLVAAAGRLGGAPEDMARLLAPIGDDEDLLGAGRAAAWVRGREG